jgi:hypothetical protein
MRSVAVFLAVYLLGLVGVPTLIPYVTAVLVVLVDALRTAAQVRHHGSSAFP